MQGNKASPEALNKELSISMKLPKKILIAYVEFPPIAFDLKEAFEAKGVDAHLFLASDTQVSYFHTLFFKRFSRWAWSLRIVEKGKPLFLDHPKRWENIVAEKLYQSCEDLKPDFLLFIQEPAYGSRGAQALKRISVPKIGWYVERFSNFDRLIENSKFFDAYNTFQQVVIDKLATVNVASSYLSHAVSLKRFYPIDDITPQYDFCFVGNYSPWRDQVLEAALKVSNNVALYGPGWMKRGRSKIDRKVLASIFKGEKIVGDELNQLFNSSKVVLGATQIQGSAGLNMRFFEVLAARGVFLTDAPPELERHFVRDRHLVVFNSLEELQVKLRELLDNDILKKEIAQAGYEEVVANHTYSRTADAIISQYNSLLENITNSK